MDKIQKDSLQGNNTLAGDKSVDEDVLSEPCVDTAAEDIELMLRAKNDDMDAFSRLVKNEIRFKNAPYSVLAETVKNENFKYISFDGEKFNLDSHAEKELKDAFYGFISKIGTTDVCGQLEMCEEYSERLLKIRDSACEKSGSKIKVCGALSALISLCALLML